MGLTVANVKVMQFRALKRTAQLAGAVPSEPSNRPISVEDSEYEAP
jgi:hypothetical protein